MENPSCLIALLAKNSQAILEDLLTQSNLGISGIPIADATAMTGLTGTSKWQGAVLAQNGKFYGISDNATNAIIVDPKANGSFCKSTVESFYINKF